MDSNNAQVVSIPNPSKPGHHLAGYLVMPEQTPAPGVLIIHEAFGVNENIREIAWRFAREGYVALAADLFSDGNRAVCLFRAFYGILVSPLKNGTVGELRAALDFLRNTQGVDARRVGVIGFCMGGSYALQLACLDDELRAASVFYGQNPRPLDAVQRACPIVGSYPNPDISTKDGRKLEMKLKEYQIPHDIKIYEGARHSFFNDTSGNHHAEAADDAWRRTLAFFEEHIRVKDPMGF
ncbi:MAG TPA: alpha/beta fold hydrolase [Anaerolineae bacterium]|nr:alpha/beta fold hydrolase [Anaerolineae bacterium]